MSKMTRFINADIGIDEKKEIYQDGYDDASQEFADWLKKEILPELEYLNNNGIEDENVMPDFIKSLRAKIKELRVK